MDEPRVHRHDDAVRICIIFNPAARGEKAQKFLRLLQSFACDYACKPTSFAGEARLLAAQAVCDGFDTIVAAGGDGTLNEVLNGIGDVPGGFAKARLGVLPLGTINVFARELGIPLGPETAWETICNGCETVIDLPKVEFASQGKTVSQYFAQLAGAGLDSRAVALVNWNLKRRIGPLAYVVAGLNALSQKQSTITVTSREGTWKGELALIGNGRLYGGNFDLFPKADLRDGLLEACVFPKVSWNILARAGIGLLTKRIHEMCGTVQVRSEEFTLTSDQKTFLQVDGENIGELPARFSIQPRTLRVIVPQ